MNSFLTWDKEAANSFPTLFVCVGTIQGVKVQRSNPQIADATKITEKTKIVAMIGYGAPNIRQDQLIEAVKTALNLLNTLQVEPWEP